MLTTKPTTKEANCSFVSKSFEYNFAEQGQSFARQVGRLFCVGHIKLSESGFDSHCHEEDQPTQLAANV